MLIHIYSAPLLATIQVRVPALQMQSVTFVALRPRRNFSFVRASSSSCESRKSQPGIVPDSSVLFAHVCVQGDRDVCVTRDTMSGGAAGLEPGLVEPGGCIVVPSTLHASGNILNVEVRQLVGGGSYSLRCGLLLHILLHASCDRA